MSSKMALPIITSTTSFNLEINTPNASEWCLTYLYPKLASVHTSKGHTEEHTKNLSEISKKIKLNNQTVDPQKKSENYTLLGTAPYPLLRAPFEWMIFQLSQTRLVRYGLIPRL